MIATGGKGNGKTNGKGKVTLNRINYSETKCINDIMDNYIHQQNQLAAPRVTRNTQQSQVNALTIKNLPKELHNPSIAYIRNNFQSDACNADVKRKEWLMSGMEIRVKSMLHNLQNSDDDAGGAKKKIRLSKTESPEAITLREEKERCCKLRDDMMKVEREKENNLMLERLTLKYDIEELLLNIREDLLNPIDEDDGTIQKFNDFYLSLEEKRISMMIHINHDTARHLHIKLFKDEEIIYTVGSSKRVFSEIINTDVADVDVNRLLAEEKEKLNKLLSLAQISIEKIKVLDPTCIATRPTFLVL